MAPVGYLSHRQVGHAKTGGAECHVGRSALRATATDRSRLDGVVEKQRLGGFADTTAGAAGLSAPMCYEGLRLLPRLESIALHRTFLMAAGPWLENLLAADRDSLQVSM